MTRDEQIIAEAKKHYYDDINCFNAFVHGVKWADSHPINVWHDASKEPEKGKLVIGIDEDGVSVYNWVGQDECGWLSFAEFNGLIRWAYISDLLPKGGER